MLHILLPRDSSLPKDQLKIVKSDYFNIIEKDEVYAQYPWGNLCYDLTVQNLHSKMKWGKVATSYTLYGFPLAFQVNMTLYKLKCVKFI